MDAATSMEGLTLLGGGGEKTGAVAFHGRIAATGEAMPEGFGEAGEADVAQACAWAEAAFDAYRETEPAARAQFLETVADEIMNLGDPLVEAASAESGLPRGRIEGERARTCGQLRMFARVLRAGRFHDVRIDPAMPDRKPMPRSDLRLRNIALGPVAVFGASNFPLAFSVAGGDTASALAAGCPVVVKAHPAHPKTSALVGRAIATAVAACGLPEGVFSLLFGAGKALGGALVADPRIKAVGFTGSRGGGRALAEIAARRPEPIPVHAEMSSVNPVVLMPAALASRGASLGKSFVGSLTMGAGQFCTKPGLIFVIDDDGVDAFVDAARAALAEAQEQTMLTSAIREAYEKQSAARGGRPGVKVLAQETGGILFETDAASFRDDDSLSDEIFGAAGLLIRCRDFDDLRATLAGLEGQLTATLHLDDADHDATRGLLPVLERKVGRILANGWPTGVEVCDAMVHGGPFPATSDSRTTSVGTKAIERFLRPVCYQDLPAALLPPAVAQDNPLRLPRLVDGEMEG